MGLFDKTKSKLIKKTPEQEVEQGKLYAPMTGKIIPLEQIPDEVFSQGILGLGCGFEPSTGEVVSPVDGTISAVAQTKHAIGITTDDGAELLIHVGMDTVELNGKGFIPKVKQGQRVSCGELLLNFDTEEIKSAGHSVITAFVVTNADNFAKVNIKTGLNVKKTEEIGSIEK